MHTEEPVSNQGKINTSLMSLEETPMSTCLSIVNPSTPPPPPPFVKGTAPQHLSIHEQKGLNSVRRFLCLKNNDKGSFDTNFKGKSNKQG